MSRSSLISRDNPTKYFNSTSPRHRGSYISLNPDGGSFLYDDLCELEKNLSKREEKLLFELKRFYEGLKLYQKLKKEIEFERVWTPEEIKAEFSNLMKKFDKKAKNAEAIYTQPLPDYSSEELPVIELENQVRDMEIKMDSSEYSSFSSRIEKIAAESREIELQNFKIAQQIHFRQKKIEDSQKSNESLLSDIEIQIKKEEELYQLALKERKELNLMPTVDLQAFFDQQHLKEELEERKNKTILLNAQFEKNRKKSKAQIQKVENEIEALQNEIQSIHNKEKYQEAIKDQIKQYREKKSQLEKELFEADQQKQQIQHSIDNQVSDIQTYEEKSKSLKKKQEELDQIYKTLMGRQTDISKRRDILENTKKQNNSLKDELNQLKRKNAELEKEVVRYEKLGKDMLEKAKKVRKLLRDKEIEMSRSPSTKSIDSLKELVQAKP